MILASDVKFEVGKIVTLRSMTDHEGKIVDNVRCMIMRDSNQDEFVKDNIDRWPLERLKITKGYNADYFYEISVD